MVYAFLTKSAAKLFPSEFFYSSYEDRQNNVSFVYPSNLKKKILA